MSVTNMDDIIDSRDIIERIGELEEQLQDEFNDLRDGDAAVAEQWGEDEFEEWLEAYGSGDDDIDELIALRKLAEQCDYGDWKYGETLISRNYWAEYVEDLVKDLGYLSKDLPPFIANNINWDGVADEIEQDYMSVDFDGQEYLIRG